MTLIILVGLVHSIGMFLKTSDSNYVIAAAMYVLTLAMYARGASSKIEEK